MRRRRSLRRGVSGRETERGARVCHSRRIFIVATEGSGERKVGERTVKERRVGIRNARIINKENDGECIARSGDDRSAMSRQALEMRPSGSERI
jgi:hypothetical protein